MKKAMRRWWQDIVADRERSLTMPVFQIGLPGYSSTRVWANGAVAATGQVTIHTHTSKNWLKTGDGLEFQVQVVRPGRYRVHWQAKGANSAAKLRLTVGDQSTVTSATAAAEMVLRQGHARMVVEVLESADGIWEQLDAIEFELVTAGEGG